MTKYPVSPNQDSPFERLTTTQKSSSFISMTLTADAFSLAVLTITATLGYWRMLLIRQSVKALLFWRVFHLKESCTNSSQPIKQRDSKVFFALQKSTFIISSILSRPAYHRLRCSKQRFYRHTSHPISLALHVQFQRRPRRR